MSSEESTEIDIKINNIQCTFNVRCLLNIEDIIERGVNVELRTSRDRLKMQLRLVLTFILRSSTNRSITKYYILVSTYFGWSQNLLEWTKTFWKLIAERYPKYIWPEPI